MVHKGNIPWNKGKTGIYSEETRRRMSKVHKGKSSWMKGKHHSKETRKKISETNRGFHHSEESKKKISLGLKGRIPWNKRKPHSEEWKKKMSEANKGRNNPFYGKRHSEETRKKLSEWNKLHPTKYLFEKGRVSISWNKGKKGVMPPPWNKGLKGVTVSGMKGKHHTAESNMKNRLAHLGKPGWNKGKKTGFIPWNKGKIGTLHHSEEAKLKIKESRAKQIFPIKDSLPEIKIKNFLKQLNIEFIPHKYLTKIKHKYQCDIFIPSMNLIIECDGDYWHGNINNSRFKILNKHQINTREIDNIRTKELQEKGFNILRFWESDIKKMTIQDFIERIKPFKKV